MITIRDVAKKAKTSIATVSAVINSSAFVSQDLKSRVETAISELGFIPNVFARSLKSKRSYLIGIMVSDIRNIYYPEFYRGIEDFFKKKGYNLILCNSDNSEELEKENLQILAQKRVDGIIATISNIGTLNEAEFYFNSGIPFVVTEVYPSDPAKLHFSLVKVDSINGARKATQHLIDNGYKKIAIIAHYATYHGFQERLDGYLAALKDNNINIREDYIKVGGLSNIEAASLTHELLKNPDQPEAIFATNNRMVLGVLEALREKNLHVPEDMAVVVFDDFEWAPYMDPPLTAVRQPVYNTGMMAAKELLRRIEKGSQAKPRIIELSTELIIRKSSSKKYKK
ncbi:MAG: LacI family transcriptional regulator [Actinobacteria bacterium]|nr:LacI family transcriptional regulator [Actinomycetota bacterium]